MLRTIGRGILSKEGTKKELESPKISLNSFKLSESLSVPNLNIFRVLCADLYKNKNNRQKSGEPKFEQTILLRASRSLPIGLNLLKFSIELV
ncbi:hypothetical protein C7B65_22315 [Phormidesmis priestleyi ULC007]|uniref:Uncharacterized protein n=1 Tax=Phormidesmis priestleyi ULC007 TaxID=1920490 RepID=A0A2T1D6Z5_9CYAN|nr:hypothetical protein C7B65_22315 [Phormidesmis priestleyi ULC007]PZO46860.1 MAG: hypothetical protein DCF14_21415 [Phormidesmis priestleyi]